jgi:AcrR family transcriptional regulator
MNELLIRSPMRRAVDGAGSLSRARILAVARKRFEAFGYRRTSVGEIASDAGVAVGTIYRHYPSKEAVLLAVVQQATDEWLARARTVLERRGSAIARLQRLGEASVETNRRDKILRSILARDTEIILAPLLDQIHARLLERNVAMIADVIRDGIRAGELRRIDPELAAFVLFVAGERLFNQRHRQYGDVLPVFMRIVMGGLQAQP